MSLDKLSQIRKREKALQQKAKTHSEDYGGLHNKRKLWNHNTKIEYIAHTSKD